MRRLQATPILACMLMLVAAAYGEENTRQKAPAAPRLAQVPRKSAFEVKIGLHMCGWGAKPLPDLLIAARTLSYDGVELAPVWLKRVYDASEVDGMLREHAVPLAPAVFVGADNYCDPAAVPGAVEKAETFSRWIKQRGGDYVIFSAVAGKNGRRTEEERRNVRRAYEAVGNAVRAQGCVPLYHNHYVVSHEVSRQVLLEDLEDIDWNTWRLCLDTGHLVLALQDPVAVFQRWGNSVAWVHCKDVRTAEFPQISTPRPFSQMHPHFTELGHGVVDFSRIVEILKKAKYTGWLVVEQDHTDKTPYQSARISREYLRQILGR